MKQTSRLKQRLNRLEDHLKDENPDLVQAVHALREMDNVAHRMGLLPDGESYANKISWWPLISVLGTFSAGKSSFINTFLGEPIQKTGNQAIDDHFTVITYSRGADSQTLPGQALDSDPRFPFYRISEELHEVIPGEGEKIDHYLQMKVVPSEVVKGKILIDSPGFDADEQRKSVLEITDHIIGLSDLVLVFFDGRHPEVGAMRDTLAHLVSPARDLKDSDKFLFILNQIDTSAREDNLEEVVAAWRSALSSHGLSTGNFYVHFNDELAVPVADERVWSRYTTKRNNDYAEITKRIRNLDTHRTYRIIGKLKPLANDIEKKAVPKLREAIGEWRKNVLVTDMITFAVIALVSLLFMNAADKYLEKSDFLFWLMVIAAFGGLIMAHFSARTYFSNHIAKTLKEESYGDMDQAFLKNTSGWRSVFFSNPTGFNTRSKRMLEAVRDKSEAMIVSLNTKMANPSGKRPSYKTSVPSHSPAAARQAVKPEVKEVKQASASVSTAHQTAFAQEDKPLDVKPILKTAPSKPEAVPVVPTRTPENKSAFASTVSNSSQKSAFNTDTSLHKEKIEIIDTPITPPAKQATSSVKSESPMVSTSTSTLTSTKRTLSNTSKPKTNLSAVKKIETAITPTPTPTPKKKDNDIELSSILTNNTSKTSTKTATKVETKSTSNTPQLPLTKPLIHKEAEKFEASKTNGAAKPEDKA